VPSRQGISMVIGQKIINKKLGEILLDAGKITKEHLDQALKVQAETGKKTGEILIDLGFCNEEDIIVSLSTQYGYPYIKLENYDITPDILKTIPKGLARKYNCLPLDRIGNIVSFVVADPVNLMELKKQEQYLNCKMQFFLTTPSSLNTAIKKYYEK
jgi:type IV pilus assembly protein PilB